MFLDETKFKNYHCDQWKDTTKGYEDDPRIETYSIGDLRDKINWMIESCTRNKLDPYNVPVFIETGEGKFCVHDCSIGFGGLGMMASLRFQFGGEYSDRFYYVAPDSKPENGEYWSSRGVGYDLSGFVKSKKAGERLLNMVKIILDTQEPKSYLDYREREPDWIQFKFQKEEFDLEKLDEMARANDDILTFDILKECKVVIAK